MKRKYKILIAVAVVLFAVGMGFLLFPPVSNCVGSVEADKAAAKLDEAKSSVRDNAVIKGKKISSVSEPGENSREILDYIKQNNIHFKKDIKRLKADSEAYNKKLLTKQGTKSMIGYDKAALKLTDYGIYDGVYCYVSAPTIGLRLPVYLGSTELKMSYGAAHMYGTSLPIGGETANSALAGHTGYIGRIFFDNIRSLKKGDKITVTTYWSRLNYKVTGSTIVKPDNPKYFTLKDSEDLLELITCVKNKSGGTDRYVVLCERTK